jgi:hypothetical protein
MTYANNVLPETMMYSYLVTGKMKYKKIAIITFDFSTIPLFHERPTQSNLKQRDGLKRK